MERREGRGAFNYPLVLAEKKLVILKDKVSTSPRPQPCAWGTQNETQQQFSNDQDMGFRLRQHGTRTYFFCRGIL
jgi:hypothetical protein